MDSSYLIEPLDIKKMEGVVKYTSKRLSDIDSCYFILTLPKIELKEKYKEKYILLWNINLIKREFCKNAKLYLDDDIVENMDFTASNIRINFGHKNMRNDQEKIINSSERCTIIIPQYFTFIECLNKLRENYSDTLTFPFEQNNFTFVYEFETDLSKFIIVTSKKEENCYFDNCQYLILNKDDIKFKEPTLMGKFYVKNNSHLLEKSIL